MVEWSQRWTSLLTNIRYYLLQDAVRWWTGSINSRTVEAKPTTKHIHAVKGCCWETRPRTTRRYSLLYCQTYRRIWFIPRTRPCMFVLITAFQQHLLTVRLLSAKRSLHIWLQYWIFLFGRISWQIMLSGIKIKYMTCGFHWSYMCFWLKKYNKTLLAPHPSERSHWFLLPYKV